MRGRSTVRSVRSLQAGVRVGWLLAAGLAVGLLPVAALAQAQAQPRGGPCGQEIKKYCPDEHPGTDEFRACFEQHKGDLTPQCSKRLAEGQERFDKLMAACEGDIHTHCSEIERGSGQLMRCLGQHADKLSDSCKEAVPQRMRRRAARAAGRAAAKAPAEAPAPAGDTKAEE